MSPDSTQNKIKTAAARIFQQKGYEATKVRDIASAAEVNLALINYHFQNKENLYKIVMEDAMQAFAEGLIPVINDQSLSLSDKITKIVEHYIDLFTHNPDIARFVINEVRQSPETYIKKLGIRERIAGSHLASQFMEMHQRSQASDIDLMHFVMNMMSMIIMPMMMMPMIKVASGRSDEEMLAMMQERKQLIPLWISAMMSIKPTTT